MANRSNEICLTEMLTEIKQMKGQVAKISGYNTVLMKQLGNIDSVKIDADVADIFADTVGSLEQNTAETTGKG